MPLKTQTASRFNAAAFEPFSALYCLGQNIYTCLSCKVPVNILLFQTFWWGKRQLLSSFIFINKCYITIATLKC